MNGEPRQLIESKEYTEQLSLIGTPKAVDEAINALTWGISKGAEDFEIVPGLDSIRVAKTDAAKWGNREIPRLIVFFRIEGRQVHLLWIEKDKAC
jgi:hypothetical protein